MLLLFLACTADDPPFLPDPWIPTVPEPADDPPALDVSIPTTAAAPLRRVVVHAEEPLPLVLQVSSPTDVRTIERPAATDHDVLLMGLVPDTWYEVRAALGEGAELVRSAVFLSEPVPTEAMPILDVLVNDRERAEPGWLLFSARAKDGTGSVAMLLDEELAPRWWTTDRITRDDLRLGPNGTLWAYGLGAVVECGWDLVDLHRYPSMAHHEAHPLPDGSFWTMVHRATVFDAYPPSYQDLVPVPPSVAVEDNPLVHVAADGTTLVDWPLADRLDRARISWDGRSTNTNQSFDWVHANAVVPDGAGGLVVSLRNQDAIVHLDAAGALDWILGDPLGWSFPFQSHLLHPIGDLTWPYHQHGPDWHPDDQLLVLFDNHLGGYTPYGNEPLGPIRSRVVGYEIDGPARTVRQVFELTETATGPLNAIILGNADLLPVTGNVLANFGYVRREQDIDNTELGFGETSARIVEFDLALPEEPAVDLRVRSDVAVDGVGWEIYRARKIPSPIAPEP